jgi:hypothetical protein
VDVYWEYSNVYPCVLAHVARTREGKLMAALHQIEDDPNHKGRISLPNLLVLTCEPPQYVIGDGKAACFVFPVLDDLKTFVSDIEQLHFALPSAGAKTEKPNG